MKANSVLNARFLRPIPMPRSRTSHPLHSSTVQIRCPVLTTHPLPPSPTLIPHCHFPDSQPFTVNLRPGRTPQRHLWLSLYVLNFYSHFLKSQLFLKFCPVSSHSVLTFCSHFLNSAVFAIFWSPTPFCAHIHRLQAHFLFSLSEFTTFLDSPWSVPVINPPPSDSNHAPRAHFLFSLSKFTRFPRILGAEFKILTSLSILTF